MRVVMFYHSLVSDWNHGNAHFLRGIASELLRRGHRVEVLEPADGWSAKHLLQDHGVAPLQAFAQHYASLRSTRYALATLDLERVLDGADLVIVHEWNAHELVQRIGAHRRDAGVDAYRLLFHDTHHRAVTDREGIEAYDLRHYDGVLAFGSVLRELYLRHGWACRAWTWHEAADVHVFHPLAAAHREGDLVWVGNWGDGERADELQTFLLDPVHALGLKARVHGVRYPVQALKRLAAAGIEYGGWLANFEVPRVFAQHAMTVHVPRRPYAGALPGIPTIRVFEALACGIPLICAPWEDCEALFRPGRDYLLAADGAAMQRHMRDVLHDPQMAVSLARNGLETILGRHTCSHRVDELLAIAEEIAAPAHKARQPTGALS